MRKTIFLTLIATWASVAAFAQLDTFKLSNYSLPEMKRHYLVLDANVNGYGNNYDNSNFNYLNLPVSVRYNFYRNTKSFQNEASISESFLFTNQKSTQNTGFVSKSNSSSNTLYISTTNRSYQANKSFIGFSADISSVYNASKQESDTANINSSTNTFDLSTTIVFGIGRIEQVEDARLAVYILDELYKTKKLTKMPNGAEIIEFAKLISKLKNERIFDARIKKLYEIEQIDAFLREKAWLKDIDVRYFNSVNDNWDYGQTPLRATGSRLSMGIGPVMQYVNYNGSSSSMPNNDYDRTDNFLGYMIDLNYVYEKPQNLHWQHSFLFDLQYQKSKTHTEGLNTTTSDEATPLLSSQVSYTLGYYPNTRTSMSMNLKTNYSQSFAEIETATTTTRQYQWQITPVAGLNISYYFSPQLKFNLGASLSYKFFEANTTVLSPNDFSAYGVSKGFNHSYGLGFTYSFF